MYSPLGLSIRLKGRLRLPVYGDEDDDDDGQTRRPGGGARRRGRASGVSGEPGVFRQAGKCPPAPVENPSRLAIKSNSNFIHYKLPEYKTMALL